MGRIGLLLWALVFVLVGLLLSALLFVLGCGSPEPGPATGAPAPAADSAAPETQPREQLGEETAEQLRSGSRAAGAAFAERLLADRLRSPTSAEYPWDLVRSRIMCDTDDYFGCVVTGVVDADNAFGAKVREPWKVVVVLDRTNENWVPIFVSLSDQLVFGSLKAVEELEQMAAATEPEAGLEPPPAKERPEPELRTWTDDTGQFQLEARFVSATMGRIKLRKEDGSEISLPMERLSESDREWLRKRARN